MDKIELWEILVSLSANDINLSEAHDQILHLFNVIGRSEQLPNANKHQCNCSNAKDRLDCGFECYNT
jgi:hypothetical protein